MSESDERTLSGPGAGLSKTGRTADQMHPGDAEGTDYSDPSGLATAAEDEDAATE